MEETLHTDDLVTLREAAVITGRSPCTIEKWQKNGYIVPVQTVPHRLFHAREVALIASSRRPGRRTSKEALLAAIKSCIEIAKYAETLEEAIHRMTKLYEREENARIRLMRNYVESKRITGESRMR